MLLGKLKNRVVEIVKVQHTVKFSDEKDWVLVCLQPGNLQSLEVCWHRVAETRFEWVREFRF